MSYDVVIDALTRHRDQIREITMRNNDVGLFNMMDQIRLEQIVELDKAIAERTKRLGET